MGRTFPELCEKKIFLYVVLNDCKCTFAFLKFFTEEMGKAKTQQAKVMGTTSTSPSQFFMSNSQIATCK
jgi:hypothetical protein